ncbi:Flp family type IVb pilin [Sandaracinobacteroides sp. A072]|uniref:Flp family type IVb pilin n=1 Tax=Sandaracinobacteroides sp. A072 TaxID=3461146 RepID=UPI0040438ABA
MRNLFKNLMADKSGASAAEYALIIAVFGVFVVAGMTALGGGFQTAMGTAVSELEGAA